MEQCDMCGKSTEKIRALYKTNEPVYDDNRIMALYHSEYFCSLCDDCVEKLESIIWPDEKN